MNVSHKPVSLPSFQMVASPSVVSSCYIRLRRRSPALFFAAARQAPGRGAARMQRRASFPIRREDVEFIMPGGFVIGGENQLLAVRRKLRKRGESAEIGDLPQAGAIQIDEI